MAAKRNASGLSALPRPSLDNEELVRNGDHRMDVDEDQRKPDQICNSLKRADKGVSGQNPGGRNSWEIGAEYQSGGALPVLPLLDWAAGKGLPGGGGESRITKFTGMVTFALQPPFTVFANNQILRTPSIALGIF